MARNKTTQAWMYSEAFARAILGTFTAVPGAELTDGVEVHLIADPDFTPTPDKLAAAYAAVEADFTDYAEEALTLALPVNLGANVEGAIGNVAFVMTTNPPVTDNTIYGYWLQAGTVVVGAEKFAVGQEVAMANHGDYLSIDVKLPVMSYQDVS